MALNTIEPHKITRPIQLLSGFMVGLGAFAAALLAIAANIENSAWLPVYLFTSAIALVSVFGPLFFWVLVRYRGELQDDSHYAELRKRQDEMFENFQPENLATRDYTVAAGSLSAHEDSEEMEKWRISKYQRDEGLFLIHTWRPSNNQGQVADIIVQLHQHYDGPLHRGDVEKVQYNLGPKFFAEPVSKINKDEKFRLEISAYGPVLCVANVFVRGREEPIRLERYLNFEQLD